MRCYKINFLVALMILQSFLLSLFISLTNLGTFLSFGQQISGHYFFHCSIFLTFSTFANEVCNSLDMEVKYDERFLIIFRQITGF